MMSTVELLQQIGLNKYEAEAYYTLLAEGPLTGYELGKRSQVPLSRSYEILERLTQKGLALVQPGDPPRYTAEPPGQFLGQVRSTIAATLDALANALADLPRSDTASEFWVLRGRQHILARMRTMIADAQRTIDLSLPGKYEEEAADALALAQARGCSLFRPTLAIGKDADAELLLLLIDGREALVGTLAPVRVCQAVVSANQALVAVLGRYFARPLSIVTSVPATSTQVGQRNDQLDWVAWEDRKQRRLWSLRTGERIA